MKRIRLTEEHGFWCLFWVLALVTSLFWDKTLGRTPDALITLIDVTSLTLALAVMNRGAMERFPAYRCWVSLIIYLTAHWVWDWLLVLVISCMGVSVFFLIAAALGDRSGRMGLIAYVLLTAAVPTVRLIRNIRLLRPSSVTGELWRFDATPRWLLG